MEPRTTSVEGESNLQQAGESIGVSVRYETPAQTPIMPRSGGELIQDAVSQVIPAFVPGVAALLLPVGIILIFLSRRLKRK